MRFHHRFYNPLFPYLEGKSWTGHRRAYLLCACPPLESTKLYLEACGPHDMDIYRPRYWNPQHHPHEAAVLWKYGIL